MGFIFGIGTALATSLQNMFFKGLKDTDPFLLNLFRFLFGLPIIALLVTIFSQWTVPPSIFWVILFGVSLPVELALSYLYVRAFQYSPQSLVGPLFSLSPLFLIPLGSVFLRETPSLLGFLGIA